MLAEFLPTRPYSLEATWVEAISQVDVFALAHLLQTPKPNGYGLASSETGLYMVVIILSYALAAVRPRAVP